jgi:hypothetical protein
VTEEELRSVMSSEEVAYLLANMPKKEGTNGYDYVAFAEGAFSR